MRNRAIRAFADLPIFPKIIFSLLLVGITPIFLVALFEIFANEDRGGFKLTPLILCFSFFLAAAMAGILTRLILAPVCRLLKGIERVSGGDFNYKIEEEDKDEFGDLARAFNKMSEKLNANIREKEEYLNSLHQLRLRESQAAIATQVAHDIRSPLAALDAALKNAAAMPEDQRTMVRHAVNRIRDIANHLLEKNRQRVGGPAAGEISQGREIFLLSSVIDPVVTEKRVQFGARGGVDIDFDFGCEAYGLFAKICPTEFKRIISNLIDNAVEALGGAGSVRLGLGHDGAAAIITVSDTGKGIPPEVLARLGAKGETHGKEGGSGLGLFHARTTLETWGGSLAISSEPGKGTRVTLKLPKAAPPPEFVAELNLMPGRPVIILDDDSTIHQVWQGRFESARVKEHDIETVHFSGPVELREWARANPEKAGAAICLFDYELLGYQETGLSLAQEIGLSGRTILVTSRYEERHIIDECRRLGVGMIPKGLAGFVPISIAHGGGNAMAVLLDDDALVHMNWNLSAKKAGIELKAYKTRAELEEGLISLPKDTPVYIDSDLGDGVKGEDIAVALRERGFTNITMSTGHAPDRFSTHPWLKVIGKEPPWS